MTAPPQPPSRPRDTAATTAVPKRLTVPLPSPSAASSRRAPAGVHPSSAAAAAGPPRASRPRSGRPCPPSPPPGAASAVAPRGRSPPRPARASARAAPGRRPPCAAAPRGRRLGVRRLREIPPRLSPLQGQPVGCLGVRLVPRRSQARRALQRPLGARDGVGRHHRVRLVVLVLEHQRRGRGGVPRRLSGRGCRREPSRHHGQPPRAPIVAVPGEASEPLDAVRHRPLSIKETEEIGRICGRGAPRSGNGSPTCRAPASRGTSTS